MFFNTLRKIPQAFSEGFVVSSIPYPNVVRVMEALVSYEEYGSDHVSRFTDA